MLSSAWKFLTVAAVALIGGLLAVVPDCAAQGFPSKSIRLVVPYGAGGGPDVLARVIGQKLSENVGQPVVVDNRPGAGGILAAQAVMNAPADGYTLFVADTGHVAINPGVYPKLPYDPIRDFTPVCLVVSTPFFLAVNASLPIHSVKELVDYAKANPGLPYGSSGNGSLHHLGMELLKSMAGIGLNHVPYKGVAQSVPALITGEVAVIMAALPSLAPHVKSGKIRLIGVGTPQRANIMPEVPTIAESGVAGYELQAEAGFLAPAGTPREVVVKLNAEVIKALRQPDVVARLASQGVEVIGTTSEQYGESIRARMQKFGKLVKEVGVHVD